MFNSKFLSDQIFIINKRPRKYRLFYALLFKYYEINTEFFDETPRFSGSLITNIAKLFGVPRTISTPSKSVLAKYYSEIREYFGFHKKYSEEFVRKYVFETLPMQQTFDINIEKVITHLKHNKIETIRSLDKVIDRSIKEYENILFTQIHDLLNDESKAYLDGLLITENRWASNNGK